MKFHDASLEEIDQVMKAAKISFSKYRLVKPRNKAAFLETIALKMEQAGDALILKASEETNLPAARLMGERSRASMQLRSFAKMLLEGNWVEASIDTAQPQRQPLPKPDIRKMLIPIGPVVVFGASNFPFAFSTAGGDTASALAAGCPVVVKAHQAHPETSHMVYEIILSAIKETNMPANIFQHVHGSSFETGKALVQHDDTAAVGFTGSFTGGRALYDYASQRKTPIPVFSEMGSVNPVVFLPGSLKSNAASLAQSYTGSVTGSMGQFCTKPGLLFAVDNDESTQFIQMLRDGIAAFKPSPMLHPGINKSYIERSNKALKQEGVQNEIIRNEAEVQVEQAMPSIASVKGKTFLNNPLLHEEVFGPFALVVKCKDITELKQAWLAVSGQLTTSIMGTDEDFQEHPEIIDAASQIAGRVIFNGIPTGVEVCPSMMHGGPYPATTDGRFTAVGTHAVKRWVRPVSYQNCPDYLLPDELKNGNPLKISRWVNNEYTSRSI